ncbi:MAG: DUF3124 domain-containing protein [Nonlabens sp.]|nr:DUF3124 domain-containing protein [Nonlabens sp.]
MKIAIILSFFVLSIVSCDKETDKYPVKQANWENRKASIASLDSLTKGKTYLPIYSHIYHIHEHRTFDLTATVSMRNISTIDTLYISKANYHNTAGKNIRTYLNNPVYLAPLETLEIIIAEQDIEGGSGANFIFDWAIKNEKNAPVFEAVMISTNGQQGLSFTTRGVPVSE